jgi:hypothetical protein
MKKVLPFLSLLILSCTQSASTVMTPKIDTVLVVCRQSDNQTFIDSAIRTIYSKKEFKDSASLQGVITTGTSYRLLQAADTLRDSLHRPIFDANHAPKWQYLYSSIPVIDSLTRYIQPITLPLWPKKK